MFKYGYEIGTLAKGAKKTDDFKVVKSIKEWWNIHPDKFPDEHQAGIHGVNAPASKLFPRW